MKHDFIQGSQEWLDFRKGKIGASQVAAIMGVSPYLTPYQLWSEMVGMTPPQAYNPAMARGNRLEPEARAYFEKMMGIDVKPEVFSHEEFPWLICSLDGMSADGKLIVEIKCLKDSDHQLAVNGKVPSQYFPQLQMQMAVTGLDRCHYFSYNGGSGAFVVVMRDDVYVEKMIKECNIFYERILSYTPPDLEERDYVDMKDNMEWTHLEKFYSETTNEIKALELKQKELRERLEALADKKNVIGKYSRFTRFITKGSVDYAKVPELKGVDLEAYRKAARVSYRITLNKSNS